MNEIKNAIDERLAAALEASNYRVTLNLQKEAAKLKLQNNLLFSTNGGIFSVDRQLISFVFTLINIGKNEAILIDNNDNPIEIKNLKDFLDDIIGIYYEGMNDHLIEFNKIKSARTTSKVVNW